MLSLLVYSRQMWEIENHYVGYDGDLIVLHVCLSSQYTGSRGDARHGRGNAYNTYAAIMTRINVWL